jgi:long-chain acyl-CoA synthetase
MALTSGLLSGEREFSFEELQRRSRQASAGFAASGVKPGDTVAVLLRNDIPFLEASVGATRLGAYAVPINWHFKTEEIAYILADCRPRVLVAHADLIRAYAEELPADLKLLVVTTPPEIAEAYHLSGEVCEVPAGVEAWEDWVEAQADDTAPPVRVAESMIYTSGTTGHPKGVRRFPRSATEAAALERLLRLVYGFRQGMRTVMVCPLYHSAPNAFALRPLNIVERMVLQSRFDPQLLLQQIEAERISHLLMTPTHFVRLLKLPEAERRRHDISSLEFVSHVGAPCSPGVKQRMIEWFGPIINEFYGSTEAGIVTFCNSQEWLARPGTVGRPVPNTTVRIYGENGELLPPGRPGEIFMRVHDYPDFTYHGKEAARRAIERDGLITNGDIGELDEAGYLFIRDRKRDMVISGGANIYPTEIEAVLVTMEGVRDGVVFGIPDDEYGEALLALVEPMPGATLTSDSIRSFLALHLADYKVPRRVELRTSLPREDTGKIFKRSLREPYWHNAGRAV